MSIVVDIVSFVVSSLHRESWRYSMLKMFLASGAFFISPHCHAQTDDSLLRQRLDEVEISAQRTPTVMSTAAPTQVVDAEQLQHMGSLQLSDAVKQLAGVTLKDYGGVGGIKTVSSRGLGSQFSAITIDGIPVDDSQNGQVDLGRYTLGNAAYISLSQGHEQSSLLSARAYAAGNVLNMETAEPQFWPGERVKLKAGFEGGSFGLLSPTLLWEQRWSRRLKSTFYVNYLRSDGDYPFTLYYTRSRDDSSSVERRRHSAVWMLTADANLFYTIGEGNTLTTKVHLLTGAHELPGPVSFYSQIESRQSSSEELAFAQTRWKVEREQWKAQLLGKVRYSYDTYRDTTAGNDIFNDYRQAEAYLSGSLSRRLADCLDLDLAADGSLSRLASNLTQRNRVTRLNISAVASLRYHDGPFEARGHALYTDVSDRVNDLDTMPTWQRLTPFLSLMYRLGDRTTLRAFYKHTYRVPNFSELYFFQIMPRDLRPEQAHQVNLGITYSRDWQLAAASCQLSMTLDGYYNHVNDKIVARPTNNMYYWSILNLGTVDILGLDLTAALQLSSLSFQLNYSFQHAVDHTDPASKTYGHQVVYLPRHSGGGTLRWEHSWVNLGASAMVVGHRYTMPQNADDNRLPAYCDLSLSADRRFDLHLGTLTLRASILNLLDTQYEVVASYPMMGRNWRIAVTYEF